MEMTFQAAEEAGLKLATRGRFVALVVLGSALVYTRDSGRTHDFLLLFLRFALIGFIHYVLIGSNWDRAWVK
jgi:adenylate cyclase